MWEASIMALALMIGSGWAANAQAPNQPGLVQSRGIDVQTAHYGREGTAVNCTAIDAVRRACQGKLVCSVAITADLCPAGQAPDILIPSLVATFRCSPSDLKPHQVIAERPFTLRLSCLHG